MEVDIEDIFTFPNLPYTTHYLWICFTCRRHSEWEIFELYDYDRDWWMKDHSETNQGHTTFYKLQMDRSTVTCP